MSNKFKIDYVCRDCGGVLYNTDSFDGTCEVCGGSLLKINTPRIDPKSTGVPNICFSLTDLDDEREEKFRDQRINRGFDDSETWSLDYTIAEFIIPRLERYNELSNKVLERDDQFIEKIDKFLTAMKLSVKDIDDELSEQERCQQAEGLEVFPEIFRRLWW